MSTKRLLYLSTRRLLAVSWRAGRLEQDGAFENNEGGTAEFARYVADAPDALYYVVADLVEEDFFQENIPHVRGTDRTTLLARKMAQRYRDTSLALASSLGFDEGARREERILFSSFTNTQQIHPWLSVLKSQEAKLVGVFSTALITPLLARSVKFTAKRFVLATHLASGLRQSYVEDGAVRFSRLGRADGTDARATAEACVAESTRIQQYLINLRILARDSGPLDIVVLAPADQETAYRAAFADHPRLNPRFIDLDEACQTAGLISAPADMLGERIFLHVLATAQPRDQFASHALRRFYHLWRARVALLSGGVAACAFCLLLSGVKLIDALKVRDMSSALQLQVTDVAKRYEALQASFPKTPLARENLKTAVAAFEALGRQTAMPYGVMTEISQALAAAPKIDLDKIEWEISDDPRAQRGTGAPGGPGDRRAATPAPAPAPAGAAAAAPAAARRAYFEVVEISARINSMQQSDFRGIKEIVDEFVAALKRRPGVEIVATRLPFDLLADRPLTGDAGSEDRNETPRFTVIVARRIKA